jgi:hypothetical protein
VIEACWNWATLYDLLEDTPGVAKVVLSNPAKNRIIADAQIKNDKVDAKALATLLRGNFVSTVHVPGKEVRQKKNTVRQRLWLARLRTMVRNRIHTVLDRHPRIEEQANRVRPSFVAVYRSSASPAPPRSPRTRQRPRGLPAALPRTRRAGLRRSGGGAAGRSDERISVRTERRTERSGDGAARSRRRRVRPQGAQYAERISSRGPHQKAPANRLDATRTIA